MFRWRSHIPTRVHVTILLLAHYVQVSRLVFYGLLSYHRLLHECRTFNLNSGMQLFRTGKSQWSCDGNSYNQVSLCSTLALLNSDKTTTFESFGSKNADKSAYDSSSFLRRQDPSSSGSMARLSYTKDSDQREYSRTHGRAFLGFRHVNRCFDGGELGKICCCSTDMCNASQKVPSCFSLLVGLVATVTLLPRLFTY